MNHKLANSPLAAQQQYHQHHHRTIADHHHSRHGSINLHAWWDDVPWDAACSIVKTFEEELDVGLACRSITTHTWWDGRWEPPPRRLVRGSMQSSVMSHQEDCVAVVSIPLKFQSQQYHHYCCLMFCCYCFQILVILGGAGRAVFYCRFVGC